MGMDMTFKNLLTNGFRIFILTLFVQGSVIANEKDLSMKKLNEYMGYMTGPSAPQALRDGAMNLGSIHSKCYGVTKLEECRDRLRQAGDINSSKFISSFEDYYPKLKEFKKMVDELEAGHLNPYEPSNHLIFLYRNCDMGSECFKVSDQYINAVEDVSSECSLTRRSNTVQFTVAKIWDCFDSINSVFELEEEGDTFQPGLGETSHEALVKINKSEAKTTLDLLNEEKVFEKCEEKSDLVDEAICSNALNIRSFLRIIKKSIDNRGVSKDGEIDIDRRDIYSITNDYDDLSPASEPDKYKGFLSVEFDTIFSAVDHDGAEFREFYIERSRALKHHASLVKNAKKVAAAKKRKAKAVSDNLLNKLNEDSLVFHNGSVTDIFRWLQNGEITPEQVKSYVVSTARSNLRLGTLNGSSLRFTSADDWQYQVEMNKQFARQLVVNGSIDSICDCLFLRFIKTEISKDKSGRLVQIFKVEPYVNDETIAVKNLKEDESS